MKQVYLDNAATTPVSQEVLQAMKPFFQKKFGNPSEFHTLGQESRKAIEGSRQQIAKFLGSSPEEIIFTSCATESINLAHKGLIEALGKNKAHIITFQIEHKAVLQTCKHLESLKLAEVSYLPVDQFGQVKIEDIQKALRPETVLVSIMYVNNEVGTIEPIVEIGGFLKKVNAQRLKDNLGKIYFHTDATQAIQYLNCKVEQLGIDLLSFTGHKIYAPKGIGALYVRAGTPLRRQMDGGGQEFKLRAGTENVPFIVGLGKAVELAKKSQKTREIQKLTEKLISQTLKIPGVKLTGDPKNRAPHIASFIVEGAEGEALVLLLSNKKIYASTGSACNSSDLQPSHVLSAMGFPPEKSHGSLRFSPGKDTTERDINYVTQVLPKIIQDLRKMAPK